MANKITAQINGQDVNIDVNRPGVAECLGQLIILCAERRFAIGTKLFNTQTGKWYQLNKCGSLSDPYARLHGPDGISRNSRKFVPVKGDRKNGYYVTELPAEHDKFQDPDANDGRLLPM